MIHRTHLGGLCAIALPGACGIGALWSIPPLVGLWLTRSWTAWGAAALGMAFLWPWTLLPSSGLAAFIACGSWGAWATPRLTDRPTGSLFDRLLPHGAGLDGLRARVLSWTYLCRTWSWRGGDTRLALEAAHLRSGGLAMEGPPARNEYLQIAYTYGLSGVLALVGLLALIGWHLRLGDPLSASVIAGLVLCAGTSPLTALRRWLTGGDGPLFGPPLALSLTLHLDADGQVHLFGTQAADPKLVGSVLASITEAWLLQRSTHV